MNIKEEMEKYNDYKSEIKKIDRDIAKLKLEEVTISGSNFAVNGDLRPKGYMTSNLEKKVINNADKIRELEAQKAKIQTHIDYLDSLINNTLDDLERKVITLIFKNKYDKTRVAKKIYMSRANVYVILNRAIEKMNKKIDTN